MGRTAAEYVARCHSIDSRVEFIERTLRAAPKGVHRAAVSVGRP